MCGKGLQWFSYLIHNPHCIFYTSSAQHLTPNVICSASCISHQFNIGAVSVCCHQHQTCAHAYSSKPLYRSCAPSPEKSCTFPHTPKFPHYHPHQSTSSCTLTVGYSSISCWEHLIRSSNNKKVYDLSPLYLTQGNINTLRDR